MSYKSYEKTKKMVSQNVDDICTQALMLEELCRELNYSLNNEYKGLYEIVINNQKVWTLIQAELPDKSINEKLKNDINLLVDIIDLKTRKILKNDFEDSDIKVLADINLNISLGLRGKRTDTNK